MKNCFKQKLPAKANDSKARNLCERSAASKVFRMRTTVAYELQNSF